MSKVRHVLRGYRLFLAVGLLALAIVPAAQADNAGIYNPGQIKTANGEQIYTHICQGCHMSEGQGAIGAGHYPAFVNNPTLASAQYIALTVLKGRRDMPSFAQKDDGGKSFGSMSLSDEQVASVINYVRTHFGNHFSDTLTAADVKALRTQ